MNYDVAVDGDGWDFNSLHGGAIAAIIDKLLGSGPFTLSCVFSRVEHVVAVIAKADGHGGFLERRGSGKCWISEISLRGIKVVSG